MRIEEDGRIGYGEVAPIPDFGTETVGQARDFLKSVVKNPEIGVPNQLPCCAFGLSAASFGLRAGLSSSYNYELAALLPAGSPSLQAASTKLQDGFKSFKWKIGVGSVEEEIKVCDDLLDVLGPESKIRLDANGGLDPRTLKAWLDYLLPHTERIEFIEQPLPVGQEAIMAELAAASDIPIALDESLNGPAGMRWFKGEAWSGPLVIKPLLLGNLADLLKCLQPISERLVFSSVFETGVGLINTFSLIQSLPECSFAIGFDTLTAFEDELSIPGVGPRICSAQVSALDMDDLWNRLPHSN